MHSKRYARKQSRMNYFVAVLVVLVPISGFVSAYVMLRFWLRLRRESKRLSTWRRTRGKITCVEVLPSMEPSSAGVTTYEVAVRYSYDVSGQLIEGSRIGPWDDYSTGKREARKRAAGYVVGEDVAVYYNPSAVTESALSTANPFLERIGFRMFLGFLCGGIVFTAVAVWLYMYGGLLG
jgi:hypothetical protein